MAYYLGRDVSVTLRTESSSDGMNINGDVSGNTTGTFATASGTVPGTAVTDLTGLDIGIGVQDEDITYMGKKSVLKAEIKKETTVSLTRKKSSSVWDIIFNLARWGANATERHNGLVAPPADGVTANYGYQVIVNMSDAEDVLTLRNCTITGHTVSLNADGTTEETLEFVTQVAPVISGPA